jgi:beta-glucosidase
VRTAVLAFILSVVSVAASGQTPDEPYRNPALSPEKRAADLVARMTLEERVLQMQNSAPAIPRLGVPVYNWWNEALHGVAQGRATVFPEPIGLGAAFDPDLVLRIAGVISTEARAKFHEAMRRPPVTEVAPGAAPGRIAYLDY